MFDREKLFDKLDSKECVLKNWESKIRLFIYHALLVQTFVMN